MALDHVAVTTQLLQAGGDSCSVLLMGDQVIIEAGGLRLDSASSNRETKVGQNS